MSVDLPAPVSPMTNTPKMGQSFLNRESMPLMDCQNCVRSSKGVTDVVLDSVVFVAECIVEALVTLS